jgi:hypothetical protein
MKPYRVEYVRLSSWEADKAGLWLAENDEWLLLRNTPNDYLVDGYLLLAKAHIVARGIDQKRRQIARVLKLKGVTTQIPEDFTFASIVEMLRWIEQRYKVFQIADEEETCFCGQFRDHDEAHYRINSLSPRAELDLDYDMWFGFDELVTVEFDTDYLNSLVLLWQDKAKRKWKINRRSQSN